MLNNKQKQFLLAEFGIDDVQLQKTTLEEWKEVRFKCFFIESEETDLNDDGSCDISDKGIIASQIADITFKELFPESN